MSIVSIDPRDPTPIYAQLERGLRARSPRPPGARATSCRPSASSPSTSASTPTRWRGSTRSSNAPACIETRRGVGSFVSATPAQAHPPREHERRLRAFVTRVLADADAAGFTIDDVINALRARQT